MVNAADRIASKFSSEDGYQTELRKLPQVRYLQGVEVPYWYRSYRNGGSLRHSSSSELCGARWSLRTPRTSCLCRLMAVMIAMLMCLHILSCGLFFCIQLPIGHHSDIEPSQITADSQWFRTGESGSQAQGRSSPKLIPRIIHQTYRNRKVPVAAKQVMRTWRDVNGNDWQIRFYDDKACLEFVRREFPEYLEAYISLPKDVERSDFFRYMVVLRLGGVYADIDVECRQPLDDILRPTDTMVVGWESEVASDKEAFKRHFVRKRQVLQWFFAATPGHPVLKQVCDHIARHALTVFSVNANRDTLERTGPGIWTDVVLQHAVKHPAGQVEDPWRVRILPRVAFGVHPAGLDGLTPDAKEIVVLHHFLGSWKVKGGWYQRKPLNRRLKELAAVVLPTSRSSSSVPPDDLVHDSGVRFFPVSASFEPPFVIMVNLKQQGDPQSGSDVSAVLTSWGTWQPALQPPTRKPSVVNALVGALGQKEDGTVFVDIGAGLGFFSLAAASRGFQVHAFELSNSSLEVFVSSIEYNGFMNEIHVHNVALGAQSERICLHHLSQGEADAVHMRRGYGPPKLHQDVEAPGCKVTGQRHNLSALLDDPGMKIGALRISANGHEGWVLQGALDRLKASPPKAIYVEFTPMLLKQAGYEDPASMLHMLHDLGYHQIAHAGYVCDSRWLDLTHGLRSSGTYSSLANQAMEQPTWCRLKPSEFDFLVRHAHDHVPENVLFIWQQGPVPTGEEHNKTDVAAEIHSMQPGEDMPRSSSQVQRPHGVGSVPKGTEALLSMKPSFGS